MDEEIEKIKKHGIENYIKTTNEPKQKIKFLMKKYATAYYEGMALICDDDFNVLIETLKFIDANDEYLSVSGWGYEITDGVDHKYGKISSLNYFYDYEQIRKIFETSQDIVITPKLDGVNFVAYYKKGKLDYCATRGNGFCGRNVTKLFKKHLFNIPKELADKDFAINGEVILEFQDKITQKHRDYVAMYLHNKLKKPPLEKFIKFVPFGILNQNLTYFKQLDLMKNMTDFVLEKYYFKQLPSNEELTKIYENLKIKYAIDGLVLTNNQKTKQIAFKFK